MEGGAGNKKRFSTRFSAEVYAYRNGQLESDEGKDGDGVDGDGDSWERMDDAGGSDGARDGRVDSRWWWCFRCSWRHRTPRKDCKDWGRRRRTARPGDGTAATSDSEPASD